MIYEVELLLKLTRCLLSTLIDVSAFFSNIAGKPDS